MASSRITSAVNKLTPLGLTLHEVTVSVDGGEALGISIDGRRHRTSNTVKRFGRLRQSLSYVLSLGRVAGWVLEVMVGRCTYFGLVSRGISSVFFCN